MSNFDRIKPPERRILERPDARRPEAPEADREGRAALFSATGAARTRGALLGLHCSACGVETMVDAPTAVRSALPLFLLAPWRTYPIFAICPACRHRAWLRPTLPR